MTMLNMPRARVSVKTNDGNFFKIVVSRLKKLKAVFGRYMRLIRHDAERIKHLPAPGIPKKRRQEVLIALKFLNMRFWTCDPIVPYRPAA